MGTHPIFESDFDCLTDMGRRDRSRSRSRDRGLKKSKKSSGSRKERKGSKERKRDRRRERSRDRRTRSRSRSRSPVKKTSRGGDSSAILIRSRSNTPDVKIEVESAVGASGATKSFESVNKLKEPSNGGDVIMVDEIASSAYAKTFYKSKELENERLRLKIEREKLLNPDEPDENEAMMAMMGFGDFDTTQNK